MMKLLLASALLVVPAFGKRDRVLLEDVTALTFRKGAMTNARRVSAVPQLVCVGGCSYSAEPDVVLCQNVGVDSYGEVQWKCEADLPIAYKFGTTDVVCEGYHSREDHYVLAGSCGLEYTLKPTGATSHSSSYYEDDRGYGRQRQHYGSQSSGFLSSVVSYGFLAAIAYCLYQFFFGGSTGASPSYTTGGNPADDSGYGPGWGSGWGSGYGSGYGRGCGPRPAYNNNGPGFWGGLGLGSMGGYFAGRNTGGTYYQREPRYVRPTYRGGSTSRSSSRSESTSHSSTGYGTTRRR